MVNQTLARRYASASLALARDRGAVDRVGADLREMARVIGDEGAIHDFFVSPVVARPDKERVFFEVFEGRAHEIALHTLLLLVRKRREFLLGAIASEYLALDRAARGAEKLTLASARPLDESERVKLVERLESAYGKKFEVTQVVHPALIGGVRITMGDRRIDASIAGRLDALARELFHAT
ncbi:MAG: ATP synthase F1 subunit delta [Candidatus Eremiobacteraeota bacterium]|nr:ATP synthase F1 subunit delta [Candidatus Eremiobacteraeota bacterium]